MDKTITWTVSNIITVTLMVAVVWAVAGFVARLFGAGRANGNAAA